MTDTPPDAPQAEADAAAAGAAAAEGSAATEGTTKTEVLPARERDPLRDPVLDALSERLGDNLVGYEITRGDLWVRVDRSAWLEAGKACRELGFLSFVFISGLDWLPNPDLSGEKVFDPDLTPVPPGGPIVTGLAGGDTRFQVFARLQNLTTKIGITLKADLDEEHPSVASWVPIFRGADWNERECWEMFGFDFVGHPGLRKMYLPGGFEGHPMRKDFPLLAREVKPWPGLVDVEPLPGEPEGDGDGDGTEGSDA